MKNNLLHRLKDAQSFLSNKVNEHIIDFSWDDEEACAIISIKQTGDKKLISNLFFATGLFNENDDVKFAFK